MFIPFPEFDLLAYTNRLNPDQAPLWGRMSAQQMLEHLLLPLYISQGKLVTPIVTPEEKIDKVRSLFLMSDAPLRRGFEAPFVTDEHRVLRFENIKKAAEVLEEEIEAYKKYWLANPDAIHNHPVFGPLNSAQWNHFQSKHFTHHFTQFGLIS